MESTAASAPAARRDRTGFGETLRRDRWWVAPLWVAAGLALCGGYATWAVVEVPLFGVGIFEGGTYFVEPYLSPFYSPCLAESCPGDVRVLGLEGWRLSPAILLMWV